MADGGVAVTRGKKSAKKEISEDETRKEDGNLSFSKMLEIHERTIIRFIEMNTRTLNQRIDEIIKEVQDLKRSANFQEEFCKKNVEPIDIKVAELEDKLNQLRSSLSSQLHGHNVNNGVLPNKFIQDLERVKEKVNDIENRSRRNNIKVEGIVENDKENWGDTEKKLKELIKLKLSLDGESMIIERAHRVGRLSDAPNGRPRAIVARFLNWKDKDLVMKASYKLKGSGIYLNDDFSEETVRRRKELVPVMNRMREQGHYAVLKVDRLITREAKQ